MPSVCLSSLEEILGRRREQFYNVPRFFPETSVVSQSVFVCASPLLGKAGATAQPHSLSSFWEITTIPHVFKDLVTGIRRPGR